MRKVSFFRVITSNIKCALCRNKKCNVRYLPERKKYTYASGTRYVFMCEKDLKKGKINRNLP